MDASSFHRLKLGDLSVDPKVQRQLDPSRVRKLAADWNTRMVGVLTVSHRMAPTFGFDGPENEETFVILDGQTRWEAAKLVDGVEDLYAEVFEDLTPADEASMFLNHNNRKAITPRDRFRLAVVAEQEWALNIRDIAAAHNWYVQGTHAPVKGTRVFTAVTAVERIYELDEGRALKRAFAVIEKSWGHTGAVVSSETIYGLGLLFAENPTGIDGTGLVNKLSKLGVNRYVAAVNDRRRTHPGLSIKAAAQEWTKELYNRGRRTHRV